VEVRKMAEIMTDTSPAGMIAAIADGLEACYMLLATAVGGESRTTDGITVAITGLPFFIFNGVVRTRLDSRLPAPEIDRRIEEAVTSLRSRGVPFGWWRMPGDHPPDLPARLVASGFAPAGEQPGMAIDLDQLGPAPQTPKDVAVEEVIDVEGIGAHMRLVACGSGLPPEFERAFRALLQGLPFGPGKPIRYFLASEQGKPVGTSLVVVSGRAAGIFSVATAPEARGRVVGALVTDVALRAAREASHRIAILESSQMGYNVYRRLGFEEYCQIGHYAWTGEADA
jgi:GNAT superfamily N-acetyltransferase